MAISGGRMRPESLEDAVVKRLATGGIDFMYGLLDATAGTALKTIFSPEGKAGRGLISDDVLKEKAAAAEFERKKNQLASDKTRAEIDKTMQATLLTKAETEDYPDKVKRENERLKIQEQLALLQAEAAVTNAAANVRKARTDAEYKRSEAEYKQSLLEQKELEAKQKKSLKERELNLKEKETEGKEDTAALKQGRKDIESSQKREQDALKAVQKNNTEGNIRVYQQSQLDTHRAKISVYRRLGIEPDGAPLRAYQKALERAQEAYEAGDTKAYRQNLNVLKQLPSPVGN